MLQLFHLSIAKVDLNVGLFSEEERASAGARAASTVSWRQRSTEDAHEVLEQKLVASPPRDGYTDPGYGGDTGATRLRPPAGAAGGRAPLLRGCGGRSVTWGTEQGAAKLRPDTGLGPDVRVLVGCVFGLAPFPLRAHHY
jgi:hypothetical protein